MKSIFKLKLGALLFVASVGSLVAPAAFAANQDCGSVSIKSILAGPRHGSMMQVSNTGCGPSSGWICLDPDSTFLSTEKGKRMYAFVLAQYLAKQPIYLTVQNGVFAAACNGAYPIVDDVRTP